MSARRPATAFERALRLLSARAHTRCELERKLLRAGFPQHEAEAAVDECEKRHYLDDRMFAEDCAGMWLERGHGARSIRCKLLQRGVSAELAADALKLSEAQEPEAACRAIESRMTAMLREKDPRKRRAKALRFLAARGFSGAALSAAMQRLAAAAQETETPEDRTDA